jgi:hypothetical protein
VIEDIGAEDALLAVADGTGDHAVLTTDAGGKLRYKRQRIVHPLAEDGETAIALSDATGHESLDSLGAFNRLLRWLQA